VTETTPEEGRESHSDLVFNLATKRPHEFWQRERRQSDTIPQAHGQRKMRGAIFEAWYNPHRYSALGYPVLSATRNPPRAQGKGGMITSANPSGNPGKLSAGVRPPFAR
jgi:hypothetical protein